MTTEPGFVEVAFSEPLPAGLVLEDDAQELQNKTLTAPVINDPDLTGGTITDLDTPLALNSGGTGGNDAATARSALNVYSSAQVDTLVANAAAGVAKRTRVRVAAPANVDIATGLNNGDSLDGQTLSTGDWVLLFNQTAQPQNGIYEVGVTPTRTSEYDTWDEHVGSLIAVAQGTHADSVFLCLANPGGTLGTTPITFQKLTTSGELLASLNLSDLGNITTARTNLSVYSKAEEDFSHAILNSLIDQIPEVAAGAGIAVSTASGITTIRNLNPTISVRRTTNGPNINNNATLASDSVLFVPLDASSTYYVQGYVIVISDSAADVKLGWTPTTNITGGWTADAVDVTNSGHLGPVLRQHIGWNSAHSIGTQSSLEVMIPFKGILITSGAWTSGTNFTLQVAQNTAHASNTVVRAQSTLIFMKL